MKTMKTMARQAAGLFVLCFVLGVCTTAHAATATASLTVTAGVGTACTVTAFQVNFGGGLVANPSSNIDTTGTVSLTCTSGAPWFLSLDGGANLSGSTRRMANTGNFVAYQLYTDAGHTTIFGGPGGVVLGATGTGAAQFFTVFGRIATGAIASQPVGQYTDTVTVTVTF